MKKEIGFCKKFLNLNIKKDVVKAYKKSFGNHEKIIITDQEINDIINSDTEAENIITLLRIIQKRSDKFVIERPQFQKLFNELINKKFIGEDVHFSVYISLLNIFEEYLQFDSSYFDYDENGADLVLALKKAYNYAKSNTLLFNSLVYERINEVIKAIRIEQFLNIMDDILVNDKEENIKLLKNTFRSINVLDNDKYSPLMYALYMEDDEEKLLVLINKLLEAGVDPNAKNNAKYTYLHVMINRSNELVNQDSLNSFVYNYFEDVLKKSIDYGYDVNSTPSLLMCALKSKNMFSYEIYKALCNNGYDVVNDKEIRQYMETNKGRVANQWAIEKSVNYKTIISYLVLKLENNDYKIGKNFINELNNLEEDIYGFLELLRRDLPNEYNLLIEEWYKHIIENRNNNVNYDDKPISALDAIEGLRLLINDFTNKLNNQVNSFKEKINTYKNNQ